MSPPQDKDKELVEMSGTAPESKTVILYQVYHHSHKDEAICNILKIFCKFILLFAVDKLAFTEIYFKTISNDRI
jgi:hypothetical protein